MDFDPAERDDRAIVVGSLDHTGAYGEAAV